LAAIDKLLLCVLFVCDIYAVILWIKYQPLFRTSSRPT